MTLLLIISSYLSRFIVLVTADMNPFNIPDTVFFQKRLLFQKERQSLN